MEVLINLSLVTDGHPHGGPSAFLDVELLGVRNYVRKLEIFYIT